MFINGDESTQVKGMQSVASEERIHFPESQDGSEVGTHPFFEQNVTDLPG